MGGTQTHRILHNQETGSWVSSPHPDTPSRAFRISDYVKIFLLLANKKKSIFIFINIKNSFCSIEINIKGCVKSGETKKIWLRFHNNEGECDREAHSQKYMYRNLYIYFFISLSIRLKLSI